MDINQINKELLELFGFTLSGLDDYDKLLDKEKTQAKEIFTEVISSAKETIRKKNLPENYFKENPNETMKILLQIIPEEYCNIPLMYLPAQNMG